MSISKSVSSAIERGSWIRRMFEEGTKLKAQVGADKVFDLSLGNPYGSPPSQFYKELLDSLNTPIPRMHSYMPNAGYPETRNSIAEMLSEQTGINFKQDNIIMTCGAAGALNVILKSLLDPSDEVIILSPYFVEYIYYVENFGGTVKIAETDEKFEIDCNNIEKIISSKTKCIILNSPNNPTGVVYSQRSLEKLEALLREKETILGANIYVISDEPYRKIVYDNIETPDYFKIFRNTIVVTSFSKDLNIPGERIGYIAISPKILTEKEISSACTFTNRTLGFVNAPALMQRVVKALLGVSFDVTDYEIKRNFLYGNLTKLGYNIVKPYGAFYLFPKVPWGGDEEFVKAALQKNLLIVPGSAFGRDGFFRIAYCVEMKTLEDAIKVFDNLWKR